MAGREIVIGMITGPHGIRGEVKLFPLTDYPDRFLSMDRLELRRPDGRPMGTLTIRNLRWEDSNRVFLLESEELQDRSAAERLRGTRVVVDEGDRVELPEGEFWIDGVVGSRVLDDETGEPLGILTDVYQGGAQDIFCVESDDGKKHLIPVVSSFVASVDPELKRVRIRLIDGLWNV
jgi:16S rRNA processing protein RimM